MERKNNGNEDLLPIDQNRLICIRAGNEKRRFRAFVAFVLIVVLFFSFMPKGQKFWTSVSRYMSEFSASLGFNHSKGGETGDGEGTNEEGIDDSTSEDESITTEDETESAALDEGSNQKPPISEQKLFTEKDISELERGREYIINKTDFSFDLERLLSSRFSGVGECRGESPSVLIIHTYTSEEYIDAKNKELFPGFKGIRGVVSVGERVSYELNVRGIKTVHCTVIHDSGETSPYLASAETIKTMLDIYPDIKFVIDLHRDEIFDDNGLPVKTSSGGIKTGFSEDYAAQIGISVSLWGEGDLREDNMVLALKLRDNLNINSRRLCAPIILTANQYNSSLSRYYLRVSIGAVGNTTAEAIEAGEYFAEAFAKAVGN